MRVSSLTVRRHKILVWDILAFFVSIWAAYAIRLGMSETFIEYRGQALLLSLAAVLIKTTVLASLGVFRVYWRYAARREHILLLTGSLLGSILLASVVFLTLVSSSILQGFPRSVLLIDFPTATTLLFLGPELLYRSRALMS